MRTEVKTVPGGKTNRGAWKTMIALLGGEQLMDAMEALPADAGAPREVAFDWRSCLGLVRARDESAARELVYFLYPLVIKIVRYHLPRRTGEEDLAQLVFMKLFQHLDSFNNQAPLEHWVARIAVNTCLNELRAEKARPELRWADLSEAEERVVEKLSSGPEDLDPAQDYAARDLAEQLLGLLRPKDRLIVQMLHMEGCSVEEVHEKTGWSRVMIKVRAFRARQKLRKHYEQLTRNHP